MRRGSVTLLALTLCAAAAGAQESAVWRALDLEDSARWEEAAAVYRAHLRTADRVHAAYGLERALITLGRPDELLQQIGPLVREYPDDPLYRAMFVRTLLGLERIAAARAFVDEWLTERPHDPEAYRQRYTIGPLMAAEARAFWRSLRPHAASDSVQVILAELTERVLGGALWPAAREILEDRYARTRDPVTGEQLAFAAVRAGEVDRARAVAREISLSEESSAAAWLALYDGDLARARSLLRRADEADAFAVLPLAVLSRTTVERSGDFGGGVLRLARGDTVGAARMFLRAAPAMPEVTSLLLAWSARLSAARGDEAAAERLYEVVAREHPESPEAAEAVLAQARVLARRGQRDAAAERLEHLILAHPRSALVPVARRELEVLRGAVPPSGGGGGGGGG